MSNPASNTTSNIVKFPKPSGTAFNPNRPLEKNALIQAQVTHFQAAEKGLPAHLQTGINVAAIRTEGQASEYIGHVTRALHKRGARSTPKVETAR